VTIPAQIRTIHCGARGRGVWGPYVMNADARFRPVALTSRSPDELGGVASAVGVEREHCFATLDAALDAVDCDAVVITTPTVRHDEHVRRAIAAGKHVLVEKALAPTLAQARALVDLADAADVKLAVAQNYRFTADGWTMQRIVEAGEHGTFSLATITMHRYRPTTKAREYPDATVWDMASHHLDQLVACFGPVASASARTWRAPSSIYPHSANLAATLTFASGLTCAYTLCEDARRNALVYELHSERGALELRAGEWQWHAAQPPTADLLGLNDPPVALSTRAPWPGGEQGVADAFARWLLDGVEPGISGRYNLVTLAACDLVVRSAAAGGATITA
jgi:predicted dehydrogenase